MDCRTFSQSHRTRGKSHHHKRHQTKYLPQTDSTDCNVQNTTITHVTELSCVYYSLHRVKHHNVSPAILIKELPQATESSKIETEVATRARRLFFY